MRKYETVFISDPDLKDQARTDLFDKVRNIIAKEKGIVLNFDEWGNKKLAYEIKKKTRGHYVCVTYGGTGELVTELERNFRLTDAVLKFMTIVLTEDTTQEALEKEAQEIQEAASQPSPEATAADASETAEKKKEDDAPEAASDEEKEKETVGAESAETDAEPQKETE
ncbi:MAG: 30S ribosomal protein S6 [Desulfobacterales bacterium]|nr:30S ribosomal protein S6 [Desulfobacterales bacterium]